MSLRLLSTLIAPALLFACGGGVTDNSSAPESVTGDADTSISEAADDAADAAAEVVDEVIEEEAAVAMSPDLLAQVDAHLATLDIDTTGNGWKTRLPKPPVFELPSDATITWIMETNQGPLRVKLFQDVAPMHVSSTVFLTRIGFYDGVSFHRVIPGFMAQGGCPLGTGTGTPGYSYGGEFAPTARHDSRGTLSMANAGPNTDGSQFFLTFKDTPHLNDKHTVFGRVEPDAESQATIARLEALGNPYNNGVPPKEKIVINRATIEIE